MTNVRAALLFVGCAFAYAYFYQAGGWNQNSRFDLVRAIVEEQRLAIDDYQGNTGDKARFGDHVYSDKAPGLALAAVPVVAAARAVWPGRPVLWSWLATVGAVGMPLALGVVALFLAALRLGAGPGGAGFAAAVWGIGTPALTYGTLFWGHALSAAGLVGAFWMALALGDDGRRHALLALGVGLAAGWAVVTEFPAAPPAAILAALALSRRRTWRVAGGIALGALACVAVLLAYQKLAFGSAFHVGYSSVEGFAGMKEGFLGVTYPKPQVLVEILVGRFRGLLPLAPVLAVAPLGLALVFRKERGPAIAAIAIVVYYVLFNASYRYWNGGWSYGPRHLSPALPFLCLGLAPLWSRAPLLGRAALGALALWGAALALIAVATTAQPPEAIKRPVGELLWPAFADGDLSLNHQSFLEPGSDWRRLRGRPPAEHDAWNLGEKLGLVGLPSLAPLLAVWAAGAALFVISRRRPAGR